jgi:hypothetical protein
MAEGLLGFPQVEVDPNYPAQNFSARLYKQYTNLVNSDPGIEFLRKSIVHLAQERLENKMIATGGGGGYRFSIEPFKMWWLWLANNIGIEEANRELQRYLDSDAVTVVRALWVSGIQIDEQIDLGDNYLFQPVGLMPESDDKEYYLRQRLTSFNFHSSSPTAAIVKNCKIPKLLDDNKPDEDETRNVERRMETIVLLLNLIDSLCTLPSYSTSYLYATTPPGPFIPSGGGWPLYDISPPTPSRLPSNLRQHISPLVLAFEALPSSEQQRFSRIIDRLSQAKRRIYIQDKILDLGIAMEMMLLENKQGDQLSQTFSLRGAWLVTSTPEERVITRKYLQNIYTHRSQVAHSGILENGNYKKIIKVENDFPTYVSLAESICKKLLINGKPEWERLVLGIV